MDGFEVICLGMGWVGGFVELQKMKPWILLVFLCRATLSNSDTSAYHLVLMQMQEKVVPGAHPLEALIESSHIIATDGLRSALGSHTSVCLSQFSTL
jgi:hypothetical protein